MSLMEDLRVRIGLDSDDTSKDAEITVVKDTTFALMGSYCDRQFPLGTDVVEQFTHKVGMSLSLSRYPIVSIKSVIDDQDNEFDLYHSEPDTGVIHLDVRCAFHQVFVTFTGGYDEDDLPGDLLMAFYAVFDQEWAIYEGGAVSSSGEISSVSVVDVGTVRYNVNSTDTSGEGDFLPDRAKSLLMPYVRQKC